ncbi:hypothetical protein FQA39_LY11216 [Lamprigera yunnana]|nr:hypothetical protein FQA39_LY11216 [Lamprigera yunnana]
MEPVETSGSRGWRSGPTASGATVTAALVEGESVAKLNLFLVTDLVKLNDFSSLSPPYAAINIRSPAAIRTFSSTYFALNSLAADIKCGLFSKTLIHCVQKDNKHPKVVLAGQV